MEVCRRKLLAQVAYQREGHILCIKAGPILGRIVATLARVRKGATDKARHQAEGGRMEESFDCSAHAGNSADRSQNGHLQIKAGILEYMRLETRAVISGEHFRNNGV